MNDMMYYRYYTKAYKGHIVYTPSLGKFNIIENGYIVVEGSKVKGVYSSLPNDYINIEVEDFGDKLIIPGFVDIHLHASQIANRGLGLDIELMKWLTVHTFKEEAKFSDLRYAEIIYNEAAKLLLKNGTTRAVIYGTLHKESTELLMDIVNNYGIGAYVGKVSMDKNSPDYLTENTLQALKDEEEFLKETIDKYKLVKPIITPRFVPACSLELLSGLGKLAQKYNVPTQSHLSEDLSEIDFVKNEYPEFKNYASIYDYYGLLGQKLTIMAHCVYLPDEEMNLLARNKVYVAHCPISNFNLSGSVAPIKKILSKGIPVGLGTDLAAGHEVSMIKVMWQAIQASKVRYSQTKDENDRLTTAEVFFLGTKGGGSFFGKVGSFEEGYDFDALVIDDSNLFNVKPILIEERIEKFVYIGDYRNIVNRFIAGRKV
jgi:guanine deaminase